jgi:hypothetical protein
MSMKVNKKEQIINKQTNIQKTNQNNNKTTTKTKNNKIGKNITDKTCNRNTIVIDSCFVVLPLFTVSF